MAWDKLDLSFKTLIGKRSTSNIKQFYEEFTDKTIDLWSADIKIATPTFNNPAQSVTNGLAQLYTLLVLTLDTSVANNQCYYAFSSVRLKDWISDRFGDNYRIRLFDNNNAEIFPTQYSWFFNYVTGDLIFNEDVSALPKPFKITGYRYIGNYLIGGGLPIGPYLNAIGYFNGGTGQLTADPDFGYNNTTKVFTQSYGANGFITSNAIARNFGIEGTRSLKDINSIRTVTESVDGVPTYSNLAVVTGKPISITKNASGHIFILTAITNGTLYKSTDGGITFVQIVTNIGISDYGDDNQSRRRLYMDQTTTNSLICSSSGNIYLSSNSGVSWTNTATGFSTADFYCGYVEGSLIILFGKISTTGVILKSTDGGTSFTQVDGGLSPKPIYDYRYNAGVSLAFSGNVILRSSNAGTSWSSIATTGINTNSIFISQSLPSLPNAIVDTYVSATPLFIASSLDGDDFIPKTPILSNVKDIYATDTKIYIIDSNGNLYVSYDKGENFSFIRSYPSTSILYIIEGSAFTILVGDRINNIIYITSGAEGDGYAVEANVIDTPFTVQTAENGSSFSSNNPTIRGIADPLILDDAISLRFLLKSIANLKYWILVNYKGSVDTGTISGDSTTTSFTIPHTRGTKDHICQVRNNSTDAMVGVDIVFGVNSDVITFTSAPTMGETFTVVIK